VRPYTICIGFRNWHLEHLHRCLASLRRGTDAPITLCDTGTSEPDFDRVVELADVHDAYLLAEPHPEWSRSRALNAAARAAVESEFSRPDWLAFTDADMLFPRLWFPAAERAMGSSPPWLWVTPSRDLPAWAMEPAHARRLETYDDEDLHALTVEHPPTGEGGAMLVPRAWFARVGGFDEFYRGWGAEDNDLTLRARWDGLPVERLPDAWVAHQHHSREASPELWAKVLANRAYLAERVAEAEEGRPSIARNASLKETA